MKIVMTSAGILALLLALVVSMRAKPPQQKGNAPPWAFPAPAPGQPVPAGFQEAPLKHVPGSSQTYDHPRIDPFNPPDWFPHEHPPMPEVVRHGSGKTVQACSYCHLASGSGHPQSANLAGLPVAYILQQLAYFKSGERKDGLMNRYARNLSDEDARQAAQWFADLKAQPWVKVVQTKTVPKTFVFFTRERFVVPGGGTEPIGERIIEVPKHPRLSLSYDPHSGFIAYVPVGSVEKGKVLVNTGGAKTTRCATCHGGTLTGGFVQGIGNVPRIAGLFPTYIFRQLFTFKNGNRAGAGSELMKGVVTNLSEQDMLDISAYVGSRKP